MVLTTLNTPREDELRLFGDPLENLWKAWIFGFCGADNVTHRNFESIILDTPGRRAGGWPRSANFRPTPLPPAG